MIEAIDAHVGDRIRQQRAILGLTQAELARRIRVSVRRIQEYEIGTSRVGHAQLCALALVLQGAAELSI